MAWDESHQKGSDYVTSSQTCLLVHSHNIWCTHIALFFPPPIGFGRDAVFTHTSVMDHASVKLNDCMDARQHCWCQPGTGMHNVLLGLDESHQKGSDYITSSRNCLLVHLHMMHAYSLCTSMRQRCTCVFLVYDRESEIPLLKNSSIELLICTVHKPHLNKCYTTIHTNWSGTLGHTFSAASPPNIIF